MRPAVHTSPRSLGIGGWIVVALFLVSGTLHLVRPGLYVPIVPDMLPTPRALVLWSGVAELVCALGLMVRRSRRIAGWASAVLLVVVFPANVQMAVDAWQDWHVGRAGGWYVVGTLVRLPVQLPMIWWVWRVTRRPAVEVRGRTAAPAGQIY